MSDTEFRPDNIAHIREEAITKAHARQKRVGGWFSIQYRYVYDAVTWPWYVLVVLADIAVSLRTIAAEVERTAKG